MNRYKYSQTCSLFVSRMMMSKIFDVRWYQALLSADETTYGKGLGRIVEVKIKGFCSVTDCVGSVWSRNGAKTEDKQVIKIKKDSEIVFWTEDEKSEPQSPKRYDSWSSDTESKGKIEPTLKGTWEIAGSGKQLDNVLKETRVVSIMELVELELLVMGANFINKKSGRPRLHQIRRQPKTERENHLTKKDGKSVDKRNKIPCQCRNCTNPSCSYRHPPECQNYISQIGCRYGKTCFFDMFELAEKPKKKSKKQRCEWISCKLERHIFPLTKSVPIRHQITSMLRITRWVLIDICEGQGISKKPHAVVKWNAWFRWYIPPDSVRFSIDCEESQKVIVSEGHILPLTRSMPIRTSVKVSVEGNSW